MRIQNEDIKPTFKFLIYFLGGIALFFSTFRAVVVNITHDEVYTYLICVPLDVWEVVSYEKARSANNHILNTLMMKVSIALFGAKEWALRLPNLFGHVLFIIFSIRIIKSTFSWTYLGLLAFILLNFNLYLLDFFSVARGYGLAVGLMVSSVYFFLEYLKHRQLKFWILSLLFAFLSVWANFIYLLYFVTLVAIYAVVEFERFLKSIQTFKELIVSQITGLLATVITAAVIVGPIQELRELNEFRYGGNSSFFKDSYGNLMGNSLYGNHYFGPNTFNIFLGLVSVLLVTSSILILFHHLKSKKLMSENTGLLMLLFGLFLVGLSIAQHYLVGAAYLKDRRATIFLPFAAMVLSCGLSALENYARGLARFLGLAIILFSLFHFVYNTKSYLIIKEWYFDRDTKEVIRVMEKAVEASNKDKVKLEVNWLMKNGIHFYRKTENLEWLEPMQYRYKEVKGEGADFYYIFTNQRPVITDQVDTLFNSRGRMLLRSLSSK